MIAVLIQLWPFGDESRAKEIGRMYIANDGAGSYDRGDYVVAACRRGTTKVPREIYERSGGKVGDFDDQPKAARAGEVKNYPRLAYNVWRLIARAVLAAFPEERPKALVNMKDRERSKPVLDEQVMRGLRALAKAVPLPNWEPRTPEDHDVKAAIAWLDEALAGE